MLNLITSYAITVVGFLGLLGIILALITYSLISITEHLKNRESLEMIEEIKYAIISDITWIEHEFPLIADGLTRAKDILEHHSNHKRIHLPSSDTYRECLRCRK